MANLLAYYQDRAPGLRKEGRELRGPCPICQEGRDDSFAVNPETLKWCCHREDRGGDAYQLEMALAGLPFPKAKAAVDAFAGIMAEAPVQFERAKRKPLPPLVAAYDYRDAAGRLLYQVTRHQPPDALPGDKTFRQRRPDASARDGWAWGLGDIERVLYRLPELLASKGPIYLVEGEKDADNARALWSLNATTSPQGAGKFTAAMARSIAGRDVVILPDNDRPHEKTGRKAGQEHAEKAATLLRMEGCRVKIVWLPAKDLTVWIEAGGTREALLALQTATPEWAPGVVATVEAHDSLLSKAPANVHEMLQNYTVLVGSDMIWDERLGRTTIQNEMRLAHAGHFNAWLRHEDLRKIDVDKLVFKPEGAAPGELNLFKGIRMTPNASKSCARMVSHLAFLVGGNPHAAHWLTCWLAWPLKHPGAKLRCAVVLHGPQGTGKSMLFEALVRIYGGEYADIVGQTEIDSPYTGWASRKLFVVADEVEGNARFSRTRNRLKGLITGDWLGIEEKYRARRVEANHMNLAFLSNEDTPVVVEQGDRRYAVFYVEQLQTSDYYQALVDERNAGGDEALYAYLLAYDTKDFDPNGWPFETEAKEVLQAVCASPADRFLDEWAAGELPVPYGCAAARDLYEAYRVWCVVAGEKQGQLTETAFGRVIAKRKWTKDRVRTSTGQYNAYGPQGDLDSLEAVDFRLKLTEWLDITQARRLL